MSRDVFRLLRVPITTDSYCYNGDVKELARKETLLLQIRLLRSEFKIGRGDEVKLLVWNEAAKVQVPVTAGVFACLHDINVNYSPWNFFVVVSSPTPSTPTRWYALWSSPNSSRQSTGVIGHKKRRENCGQQGDGAANLWRRVCRALDGLTGPSSSKTMATLWTEARFDTDLTPEELDRLIEAATVRCTAAAGTKKAEFAGLADASPPRLKRMVSRSFLGTRNMDFLLGLPKSLPREDSSPNATVVSSPSPSFTSDTSGTLSASYVNGKN